MPLFTKKHSPPPPPPPEPQRKSLFSRKETPPSPATTHTTTTTTHDKRSSLFSRRRSSSDERVTTASTVSPTGHSRSRNFLHRDHEDASITAARQRVGEAEVAEKEADRALMLARAAVKSAREEVRRLELEAAEEARLAKIKQQQAANISNRAKPLGRHGHH